MRGSGSAQRGNRRCAVSLGHSGSRKEPKMSARSCDLLCPITADHISATCQCSSVPRASAHQCHVPVPIIATSMPHTSAHQCHISVPI
ncbi:unnamed protein product [Staurois parvus]|uniref:Uncharacterized protein n=1 Tax=Staurois parvus TaxID=386267 RepID=A0ABN9AWV2_9NEOB|nr:unnamed protein product [Staurois parvus]